MIYKCIGVCDILMDTVRGDVLIVSADLYIVSRFTVRFSCGLPPYVNGGIAVCLAITVSFPQDIFLFSYLSSAAGQFFFA